MFFLSYLIRDAEYNLSDIMLLGFFSELLELVYIVLQESVIVFMPNEIFFSFIGNLDIFSLISQ